MCGLVGIVGNNIIQADLNAFVAMLAVDVVRGDDSTGIFFRKVLKKSKEVVSQRLRADGVPANLFAKYPATFEPRRHRLITDSIEEQYTVLMGHNRSATVGGTTIANAHPFRHGHIVGAHNGTVRWGLDKLPKATDAKFEGGTDSERIFHAISQGMTMEEMEDTLQGAWCLTWFDSRERTFNLYRNDQRPMHIAFNQASGRLAYASEPWMLQLGHRMMGRKDTLETKEFPISTHLKFHFNAENKFEKLTETEVKLPVKTTTTHTTHTRHTPGNGGNAHGKGVGGGNIPQVGFRRAIKPAFLTQAQATELETFKDDRGFIRFKKTDDPVFKNMISCGCANCNADLEGKEVFFLDAELPLCSNCASHWKKVA